MCPYQIFSIFVLELMRETQCYPDHFFDLTTRMQRGSKPFHFEVVGMFPQYLDHFSSTPSSQTFMQPPPIFFMLGGENGMDGMFDGAAWSDIYAQSYGAHIVEHRYYGTSVPDSYANNDTSKSSMKYLTSLQAIEDYRRFLIEFKRSNPQFKSSQVVTFGGSYSGGLSAWFRTKYPNDVQLAVASSAPLTFEYNFTGYIRTNSDVIRAVEPDCYNSIYKIFRCMYDLIETKHCSSSGKWKRQNLANNLNYACGSGDDAFDLTDPTNKANFFRNMAYFWSSNTPANHARKKCRVLAQKLRRTTNILKAYAAFLVSENATDAGICSSVQDSFTQSQDTTQQRRRRRRSPKFGDNSVTDGTSWDWQTFNEYGDFQPNTDRASNLFSGSWTADIDIKNGQNEFPDLGITSDFVKGNVKKTSRRFNGKKINGTCIIFVYGNYDPWHTLGLTNESKTSSQNTVVFIQNGQHWDDLWIPNDGAYNADYINAGITNISNQIGSYLMNPCV